MLNIEEIKARTETARKEGFGLQQFDDLDALLAEAEQLTGMYSDAEAANLIEEHNRIHSHKEPRAVFITEAGKMIRKTITFATLARERTDKNESRNKKVY